MLKSCINDFNWEHLWIRELKMRPLICGNKVRLAKASRRKKTVNLTEGEKEKLKRVKESQATKI